MRSVRAGAAGAAVAELSRFVGPPMFALAAVLVLVLLVAGLVFLGRVVLADDDDATSRLERLLRVLLDRPDPVDGDVGKPQHPAIRSATRPGPRAPARRGGGRALRIRRHLRQRPTPR